MIQVSTTMLRRGFSFSRGLVLVEVLEVEAMGGWWRCHIVFVWRDRLPLWQQATSNMSGMGASQNLGLRGTISPVVWGWGIWDSMYYWSPPEKGPLSVQWSGWPLTAQKGAPVTQVMVGGNVRKRPPPANCGPWGANGPVSYYCNLVSAPILHTMYPFLELMGQLATLITPLLSLIS